EAKRACEVSNLCVALPQLGRRSLQRVGATPSSTTSSLAPDGPRGASEVGNRPPERFRASQQAMLFVWRHRQNRANMRRGQMLPFLEPQPLMNFVNRNGAIQRDGTHGKM